MFEYAPFSPLLKAIFLFFIGMNYEKDSNILSPRHLRILKNNIEILISVKKQI